MYLVLSPVLTEAATVKVFLLVRGALVSRLALAAALEFPEGGNKKEKKGVGGGGGRGGGR